MFIPTTTGEEKTKRKALSYGLPREIPHEDYFEGNIIYSDGSFGRMYNLSPVFIDSLDELEQENFASAVASAVSVSGCDIQFFWEKRIWKPDAKIALADPLLFLIQQDRERMFSDMGGGKNFFPSLRRCGSERNIPGLHLEACRVY